MKYHLKMERSFSKRMDELGKIFSLNHSEAQEAREVILDAMEILEKGLSLPQEYDDHKLKREPWIGFNEFHVLDDALVIYYKVEKKHKIRMVTITNHQELQKGKLPE